MKSGWDVRLPAYGFRRPALIRNAFYVGESLVDLRRDLIETHGNRIKIEPRAMQVLAYLVEHAGEVVSREQILEAVWEGTFVTDEVLTNAIGKLRRAFGEEANDSGLIQTVPKKGYVFNGIVTPAVEGDAPRAEPRVRWLRPAASFVLVLLAAGATISALLLTSRDRGPGWEIRPLTSFDGVELFPSWSPDGSLVAFSHDAFGNLDVFVMPSSGGDAIRLTEDETDEIIPRWSPDGRYIAFASDPGSGTNIYLVPPLGGTPKALVETTIPYLERFWEAFSVMGAAPWSPDGKELLFSRPLPTGQMGLWKVHVETGRESPITEPPPHAGDILPSWSFDGEWITFTRMSKEHPPAIWLLPANGGEPQPLVDEPYVNVEAAFSADSQRVLFRSHRAGMQNIWDINIRSGQLRQLTTSEWDLSVAVSSKGPLVYAPFSHQTDLYWTHVETAREERLTHHTRDNFYPRPSPDGHSLLYSSNRTGNNEIWLMDLESGSERQLTENTANDMGASWSPDGSEIAFLSNREGQYQFWMMSIDGTSPTLIHEQPIQTAGQSGPNLVRAGTRWSPDGKAIAALAIDDSGVSLWVVSRDDDVAGPVLTDVLYFDWYLDSQHVIYSRMVSDGSGREMVVRNLTTGREARLLEGATIEMAVSPDGRAVAYCKGPSHFGQELYIAPNPAFRAGRAARTRGTTGQITEGRGRWHPHNGGWSPDGKKIFYTRDADQSDTYVIENYQ